MNSSPQSEDTLTPPRPAPGRAGTLARWTTKGGLAILDQGLISGSNFLISVLLGRWLMPAQYGAFALAFTIFILLSYAYHAFLAEPQGVFCGSTYRDCLRGYLKALLGIQGILTAGGILLLGGCAAVAYVLGKGDGLPGALAGVAIASPCILFFWMMRRAFYMNMAPARSAVGAIVYFVLSTAGLLYAFRHNLVSPFSAYLIMAVAALGTGLYLLSQVNKVLPPDTVAPPSRSEAWRKHWEYGRWAIGVSALTWMSYYMYYPVVTAFGGMAEAGQLRALMNLSLPLEQSYMALSILFLPYASRSCREKGVAQANPLMVRITLLFVAGALLYWAVVMPFQSNLFQLLYKGKYLEVAYLIPYVALGTILWAAAFGPAILLRAIESPDSIFYSRLAASILSVVVGIPAAYGFGLLGVLWTIAIANVSAFLISLYILRRKSNSVPVSNPVLQGEG
jgi:O-antigen/teichoic acid export membrane protein